MEQIAADQKSRTPPLASTERRTSPAPAATVTAPTTDAPRPAPLSSSAPISAEKELIRTPISNGISIPSTEKPRDAPITQPLTPEELPPPPRTDLGREPPSMLATSNPALELAAAATADASKLVNGHSKPTAEDVEGDSELSEPDSNVNSPSAVGLNELADSIIVGAKTNGGGKSLNATPVNGDEVMADVQDEPAVSHYPKRKRNSVFHDLSESKMESPGGAESTKPPAVGPNLKAKPPRQSLGSVKGVMLGQWRDSPVPDRDNRHAVIGFIDVRDRLRTRIQPMTLSGEPISPEYPLPPGPGGSWVTFERVVFSDHLVGLDHFQVKEYVRLRTDTNEESEEERKEAEKAAVKDAIRRVNENPAYDNPVTQPAIAYGQDLPQSIPSPGRPDAKRRKVGGGFATVNSSIADNRSEQSPTPQLQQQPPLQPRPSNGPSLLGPLPGTRPTRIVMGYWKGSSEGDIQDRHAVYGILGQNDMFRVKVVRETRDGRFVDGNFPSGAGALWIPYEEVEFESHLKSLSRSEHKEYCRVRQYQLDHGELPEERIANETKAVFEAQARAGAGYKHIPQHIVPNFPPLAPDDSESAEQVNGRLGPQSDLRQSRRGEPRMTPRNSLNENELGQSRAYIEPDAPRSEPRPATRPQNNEPLDRATALARREIARVEAAQGRADKHALHRERAAAMAADAAAAAAAAAADAAATPASLTNGRSRFHESEDMQRLNKVWARQETLRLKGGSEDAKVYDGVKYERKPTGPFMGKLVSQGTIINIDGEDYVEYRVLTKPSFF